VPSAARGKTVAQLVQLVEDTSFGAQATRALQHQVSSHGSQYAWLVLHSSVVARWFQVLHKRFPYEMQVAMTQACKQTLEMHP